jgi:hypothetical protein
MASKNTDDADDQQVLLDPLLVTPAQAAALLNISVASLWTLVRRDQIPCVEFVAAGFRRPIKRFRVRDLEDFADRWVR